MKLILSVLALCASVGASSMAFAGGSSTTGPSACSEAIYWCQNGEQTVDVCIFNDNSGGVYALAITSSATPPPYAISEVPTPKGSAGAPVEYTGAGFDLSICAPGTCAKEVGHLSISDLKIHSLTVTCKGPQ